MFLMSPRNNSPFYIHQAHICVEQSAMDFRSQGLDVHIVADCSLSRSLDDRFF